jgi:hypothetical protein
MVIYRLLSSWYCSYYSLKSVFIIIAVVAVVVVVVDKTELTFVGGFSFDTSKQGTNVTPT